MEKKKKNLIEEIEQTLDKKLTVAEMYANRPRKWVLYLAIVLLIVVMVGWSASDIKFTGLTVTGTEVAKGVLHGVFSPDTALLFGTSDTDVPYLLLQTIAIAVLGTLIGAVLAIPFAFLASFNIMPKPVAYAVRGAYTYDTHNTQHCLGAYVDPRYRPGRGLRRYNAVHMLNRHDIKNVHNGNRGS